MKDFMLYLFSAMCLLGLGYICARSYDLSNNDIVGADSKKWVCTASKEEPYVAIPVEVGSPVPIVCIKWEAKTDTTKPDTAYYFYKTHE